MDNRKNDRDEDNAGEDQLGKAGASRPASTAVSFFNTFGLACFSLMVLGLFIGMNKKEPEKPNDGKYRGLNNSMKVDLSPEEKKPVDVANKPTIVEKQESAKVSTTEEVIAMTISELAKEYGNNSVATHIKYENKKLKLSRISVDRISLVIGYHVYGTCQYVNALQYTTLDNKPATYSTLYNLDYSIDVSKDTAPKLNKNSYHTLLVKLVSSAGETMRLEEVR